MHLPCVSRSAAFMALVASLGLAVASGCGESPPRAPALRNSPVYQSEPAGLRFLVPERWQQTASSTLPAGPVEQEVLLTRYRLQTSAHGGSLEVICMNADEGFDPLRYHQAPSFAIADWRVVEPPQPITVSDVEGTHLLLQGKRGDVVLGKEVLVFQRGDRLFHFIGLFAMSDPNARQQIQRAIQSIVWKETT